MNIALHASTVLPSLLISRHPATSLEDLAIKAKAHFYLGTPHAILADIAALRQRDTATA